MLFAWAPGQQRFRELTTETLLLRLAAGRMTMHFMPTRYIPNSHHDTCAASVGFGRPYTSC